ncbi:putative oxidoreductase [Cohaesibacter marisflavi]|uniref:Putative oxidoreductase n=1 Tax=Cohaesibacter marisflavi TaxID=655353 RepID=A0A1I5FXF8_9HYPH|nr:DoxX family protein [Cohaesibacter marisflavi]SFO28309.1 putative oxidoreductase [Cohaesibacter marisflavi]
MKPAFTLTPFALLRIVTGLIYIPHVLFKFQAFDMLLGYFAKVGLQPAIFFVLLAIVTETAVVIGLTFNILTKWLGLASTGTMAIAAYTTLFTKGEFVWTWNKGGVEYIFLLGFVSFIVAWEAWRQERAEYGRNFFLWPTKAK